MKKSHSAKKILVGVDFSEGSSQALLEAGRIAWEENSTIHVVHIIDEALLSDLKEYSRLDEVGILSSFEERLKVFCQEAGLVGKSFPRIVQIGHPVKAFSSLCDEIEPDLLVLGAWCQHRAESGVMGVTARQILQESKSDVLLMRDRKDSRMNRVVACVDFSAYDEAVVSVAEAVCRAERARLDILHVFYPPWLSEVSLDGENGEAFEDREREYRALLQGRLDKLVPRSQKLEDEIETETVVKECSRHCEGILSHIKKSGADLAVIGARGRSRIESMILGRIAERIVMNSSSSVYVVKNPY
ncbi:MAG: universal stress protein [Verrucomicrobiales bacterium]|nr:universal stress protein [Verrucomicrobiales bacterium]